MTRIFYDVLKRLLQKRFAKGGWCLQDKKHLKLFQSINKMRWLSDPVIFVKSIKTRLKSDVFNNREKMPSNIRETHVYKLLRKYRVAIACLKLWTDFEKKQSRDSIKSVYQMKHSVLLRSGSIKTDMNKYNFYVCGWHRLLQAISKNCVV